MTTITITEVSNLRAGDTATLTYHGHQFAGEVWANDDGALFIGPAVVSYFDSTPAVGVTLVSATREVPDLPTKVGSVIANVVTMDGAEYDWAMLADPGDDAGVSWVVASSDGYDWVRHARIISWTPCTVEVQA